MKTADDICDVDVYDSKNGLILSNYYIPEEVLSHILSYVDVQSLALRCRLVCHRWRETVQTLVLKFKAAQEGSIKFREIELLSEKLNWVDYYWILFKKPFGRNLLRNNCGQNGLKHWQMLSNGGNGWCVEKDPVGAEGLPPVNAKGQPYPDFEGFTSCFATSYHSCSKEQTIDLQAIGLTENFMSHVQPPIEISEWTACRVDCGSVYELKVALLNSSREPLCSFDARENFSSLPREIWYQVKHVFTEYGPGVRYIQFFHGGLDSETFEGHNGSKMSGGCVKVLGNPKGTD